MTKVKQIAASSKPVRPEKPRPDFPLFPHATGRWAKKIRGKFHYFGPWIDPEAALAKYCAQRDDLFAGRAPRGPREGLVVRELVNRFLTFKKHLLETGEIEPRTFADLYSICELLGKVFGLTRLVDDLVADDFDMLRRTMAKNWGPVRIGNSIQRVRSVFKFAYEAGLIDRPLRFGATFKRPSKSVLRKSRAKKGQRLFESVDLRRILKQAGVPLKAMILLGINCGFGNGDVGSLPLAAVDLARGWIDFPRPKTGIDRRCPLWPETIAALRDAKAERPAPNDADAAQLFFVTRCGRKWGSSRLIETEDGKTKLIVDDPTGKAFTKLLKALELHRAGAGFYWLRHGFETIAGGSRDQVAVNAIMGHVDASMAATYRERIDDDRLFAVVNHVRQWLFGADGAEPEKKPAAKPARKRSPERSGARAAQVRNGAK